MALFRKPCRLCGYEPDVLTETADVVLLNSWNYRASGRDVSAFFDREVYRLRLHRDITPSLDVIVAVLNRLNCELSGAARNERILEFFGTGNGAFGTFVRNLRVIDFHVKREADLRSPEEGNIATARDGDYQRIGFMSLQVVLGEFCAYAELAHTTAERCRGTGRKRRHIHCNGT